MIKTTGETDNVCGEQLTDRALGATHCLPRGRGAVSKSAAEGMGTAAKPLPCPGTKNLHELLTCVPCVRRAPVMVSVGAPPEPRAGPIVSRVSETAGRVCVGTSGDRLNDGGSSFLVGAASQPPAASSAVRTEGKNYMRGKEQENPNTPFRNQHTPNHSRAEGAKLPRGPQGTQSGPWTPLPQCCAVY